MITLIIDFINNIIDNSLYTGYIVLYLSNGCRSDFLLAEKNERL